MRLNLSNVHHNRTFITFKATVALSLLMLSSFSSQAIHLTSYRMYLDGDNRTESFIMFSRKNNPEKCSVKLKHFLFDDNGKMTAYKGKELPDNSAKPWVRYSPKHFTVNNGLPQTIRFSMRRKANTQPQEYRSYLSIYCEEQLPKTNEAIAVSGSPTMNVKPMMVQNVPVIIRTGKLAVKGEFKDIVVSKKGVSAVLTRSGTRSLYGKLALINKKTDEEISSVNSISIYTETTKYAFSLPNHDNIPAENILLRFTEDKNYGGELIIEKSVK